ncbi:MAG TPA: VWA domain-containing protein [Vicinamibacterales bacterium]|nr:VWA domain-containing protein [Vicinamibacterales bacterium]
MRYKYSKFTGEEFEGLDLDELFAKLSDLLLFSGFEGPQSPWSDPDRSMQALHDAILEALLGGDLLPGETIEQLLDEGADPERLEQLIQQLIERLNHEGYITTSPDLEAAREQRQGAGAASLGPAAERARFEVTDKGLDFLGYRALRDLLGSVGRSSFGRHDTRDFATGIDAGGAPKPYEYGDTLNLDASATLLNAVRRAAEEGRAHAGAVAGGIDVQHQDLMVAQGEYQSSCATVLMLDCSHSMILYGEDRFTPAKRVALALANLIRLQYPGDSLHLVLFHDSAEEVPLKELARVRVGPYYTNTREGLRIARRILDRQRKDMRQIVMITDGKPSAITRPDGQIYKNAFGLDPFIVQETLAEVGACRRSGILVNTFMLARDFDLVSFVRKVAEICRGKAYFTTPMTLGQYVLMDYMDRKTRTVH